MHLFRNKLVFIGLILNISLIYTQTPDTVWTKTIGGLGIESGRSIQQTSDGGFIIAGTRTEEFDAPRHIFLMKTNASGDTLWTRDYNVGRGYGVRQLHDGGYIVVGASGGVSIIRTNSKGDTIWTKIYGNEIFVAGHSIQNTIDGGFVIAGAARSDSGGVFLMKIDVNGDSLWAKIFSLRCFGVVSCSECFDSGYVLTGDIASLDIDPDSGNYDIYVIKTNDDGKINWVKQYGGEDFESGYDIKQTADKGLIIAGLTFSFGKGASDIYLVKTDVHGDTVWTKTYGGKRHDYARSIQQTSDGGYIVTGYTESFGAGSHDVYVLRTDAIGDTLWTKTCGTRTPDYGYSVIQTCDGSYVVVGYTNVYGRGDWDLYLIKIEKEVD